MCVHSTRLCITGGLTRRGLLMRGTALGFGATVLGTAFGARSVAAQESGETIDLTIWLEG